MDRNERLDIIKEIESQRGSRVIVYITGDRQGMETKIGADMFPMFHSHLSAIGKQERIDLFLYTPGGVTIAGFALVNLIREYCKTFGVLVQFRSLSCGTLICVGADEVVMSPMAQLSPIDPSVNHPLAPQVQMPGSLPRQLPVNVEDVNGFKDLGEQEFKLKEEDSMLRSMELLAGSLHPIVLGAVHRSREQIGFLAKQLMNYHCNDEKRVDTVVSVLTRERFSHDYLIGRREAREVLGLNISDPNSELSASMTKLYDAYSEMMELTQPYSPETILGTEDEGEYVFNRGVIESTESLHCFRTVRKIKRIQFTPPPPNPPVPQDGYQQVDLSEGWESVR